MNHTKTKSILSELLEIANKFQAKGNTYHKRKEEIKNDSYLNADGKRMQLESWQKLSKKKRKRFIMKSKKSWIYFCRLKKKLPHSLTSTILHFRTVSI